MLLDMEWMEFGFYLSVEVKYGYPQVDGVELVGAGVDVVQSWLDNLDVPAEAFEHALVPYLFC